MSRHGRCRCGTVLAFKSGPDGFKERCSHCGAVVRLRAEASNAAETPLQRQHSGALAFHPPAPSDPEAPPAELSPLVPPEGYNYDALRPGELPVVEMVPLSPLALDSPLSFWRTWWLPMIVALASIGAMVAAVLVLRR